MSGHPLPTPLPAQGEPAVSEVALLTTCLVDQLRPDIGEAVVRLLDRHGVVARRVRGATCCGQPAWNTGLVPAARRVARHTLRALGRGSEPVVVPSGSCATMIHEFWPRLFSGTRDVAAACAVAARVRELSDFLGSRAGPPGASESLVERVAYHDSCHMLRELGARAAPRRLLATAGFETVELEGAHWCCGFGGTFSVKLAEVSTAMADAKLDAVVAAGVDRIVGCDLSCLLHLQGRAERRRLAVTTLHLAEALADGR